MTHFSRIALAVAVLSLPVLVHADDSAKDKNASKQHAKSVGLPKMKMHGLLDKANKNIQSKQSKASENPLGSHDDAMMTLEPPKPKDKDKDKKKADKNQAQHADAENKDKDSDSDGDSA